MNRYIHFDAAQLFDLATAWEQAPELVREELLTATLEAQQLVLREIKDDTPIGATSSLRESIHAEQPIVAADNVIGVVGTASMHALPVELGTRPHFPPIEPLIDWVKAKLDVHEEERAQGIALSIARKIAARGTLAIGMFHRNFNQVQPQLGRVFAQANERIAARLGNV